MSLRRSYTTDPGLIDRVFDLLGNIWGSWIGKARLAAEAMGCGWETISIPFVGEEDGRVLSHAGLLMVPLVINGHAIVAGGVHGVATAPTHRGKGWSRRLMEELLSFADERYDTLVLTTAEPALYQRYGFRVVPESVFATVVDHPGGGRGFRPLDPARAADLAQIHRLLEERAPVSRALGVVRDKAVFAFDEGQGPLWYSDALDSLVLHEIDGDRLRLFDIIGPRVPSLDELLAELAVPVTEVIPFFSPDRLGAMLTARDHELTGGPYAMDSGGANTQLMVRGRFDGVGPVMLQRSGRC